MTCEEIDRIIDASADGELTVDRRLAAERHVASCCECRAAWTAYRELAAMPIAPTPRELRPRIAVALAAGGRSRAVRRSLAISGVIAVGAAAAATITYQVRDGGPPLAGRIEQAQPPASSVSPAESDPAEPVSPAVVENGVSVADAEQPGGGAAAAPRPALDPFSIVVLALPHPSIGQVAARHFVQCHEDAVRELNAIDGLNVIAGDRVSAYAGSTLAPEEIARELGAASVLVVGTADQAAMNRISAARAELGLASNVGSCRAQQLDAETGDVRAEAARMHPEWSAAESRSFAADLAANVREATFADRAAMIARAQASVLDPTLDLNDRVNALRSLRQGHEFVEPLHASIRLRMSAEPIPDVFDNAVIAAAIQIGTTAPDASTRRSAWRHLRGVRDPALTEALIYSVANDGDETVRCQAALALGFLRDEAGVADALARAATDSSAQPANRPGCILSVRDAARRAMQSDDELREAARRTVLNETLSSAERLAPLFESVDGRGLPIPVDDVAARAVFEIGRSAEDALIRSRAWDALSGVRNEDFAPTLREDLAGHRAEDVRASAATALTPYVDDPAIRAALERAQADPSLSVRRAARFALERD